MPRNEEEADAAPAGRVPRAAASFWGGAGGATGSRPGDGVGAPRGPSGSSTASSLVDCTPWGRRRGPRPAGERGAEAVEGGVSTVRVVVVVDEASGGASSWPSCLEAPGAGLDCEGTSRKRISKMPRLRASEEICTAPRRVFCVAQIHWRGEEMYGTKGGGSAGLWSYGCSWMVSHPAMTYVQGSTKHQMAQLFPACTLPTYILKFFTPALTLNL